MSNIMQKLDYLKNILTNKGEEMVVPEFFQEYVDKYGSIYNNDILKQGMRLGEEYDSYEKLRGAYGSNEIKPKTRKDRDNLSSAVIVAGKYHDAKRMSQMPKYFQSYAKERCRHNEDVLYKKYPSAAREKSHHELLDHLDMVIVFGEKLYNVTKPKKSSYPFEEVDRLQKVAEENNLFEGFEKYSSYKNFADEYSRLDLLEGAANYIKYKDEFLTNQTLKRAKQGKNLK